MEELIEKCLENGVKFSFDFFEIDNEKINGDTGLIISLDKPNCNFGVLETIESFKKEYFLKNIKEKGLSNTIDSIFGISLEEMIKYCEEENYDFN